MLHSSASMSVLMSVSISSIHTHDLCHRSKSKRKLHTKADLAVCVWGARGIWRKHGLNCVPLDSWDLKRASHRITWRRLGLRNKLIASCPVSFNFSITFALSASSFFFCRLFHTCSCRDTCCISFTEKQVHSPRSNCGLPFWLTRITSVRLFIVPAAGKCTHTSSHLYDRTESQPYSV